MRASRWIPRLLLVTTGAVLLSCGSDSTGPSSGVTVEIVPATDSIVVGNTTSLEAVVHDASGAVVPNPEVFWNSENTDIATVSGDGEVAAVAVGTVRVAASALGQSGLATITVLRKPVVKVTVGPSNPRITPGEKVRLQATTLDAQNEVLTGRDVAWTSSAPAVAAVDPDDGVVTGVAAGSATITATSEGRSGAATVTVTPAPVARVTVAPADTTMFAGDGFTMRATVADASGNTLTNRRVTWSSSNGAVASIDANSGTVAGVTAGRVTITATSEGKHGSTTLTVRPAPVATVSVAPDTTIFVGTTAQMRVTLRDAHGNVLSGRDVSWSSDNIVIALVDPNRGLVTGVLPGSATITARSEGKSGSATVTVTACRADHHGHGHHCD